MVKKKAPRRPRRGVNSFRAEMEHTKDLLQAEIDKRLDDEIPKDLVVRNLTLRTARLKRLEATFKAVEKLVDVYEKPADDDMLEASLLHSEELE